jgi:SAM-dependent methyltransferase
MSFVYGFAALASYPQEQSKVELKHWFSGVYAEVEFWQLWMRTRGLLWTEDFERRLKQDLEVDDQAAALLSERPQGDVHILDVGSGPLSGFGTVHKGLKLNVRAADPLAPAYQALYEQYRVKPAVPVELAFAEDLNAFYPSSSFDLVVCQNALDHTFDPWRGIRQMLEITKPGCYVLLRHSRNEAENECYSGLHQWNLDSNTNGDFMLWNKKISLNITQLLTDIAEVRLLDSEPQHIVVCLRKLSDTRLFDDNDNLQRLRDLLSGLSQTAIAHGREGWAMRSFYAAHTYTNLSVGKLTKLLGRIMNRRS